MAIFIQHARLQAADMVIPFESPPSPAMDLLECLEQTWQVICDTYEVDACLPELSVLFAGVAYDDPALAAETVLANMLLQAMGDISRWSPWYKRPLGLRLIRDEASGHARWGLQPETDICWSCLLEPLARALRSNMGVILAADLLDGLEAQATDDRVLAVCQCCPARAILIKPAALLCADIVCDVCRQPFRPTPPDEPVE